jgi:hypothetical protein
MTRVFALGGNFKLECWNDGQCHLWEGHTLCACGAEACAAPSVTP